MTETLQERIIRHEGCRFMPYVDTLWNWTIGVGHKLTEEQATNEYANGINHDEAVNLLNADIARCIDQADTQISCFEALNEIRQDVIAEMVFQLGITGVLAFHIMLDAATKQDWAKAAYEMVNSKWHSQTPDRCAELANLMLTGTI